MSASESTSSNSNNEAASLPGGAPSRPPIRNEYDERNMKFCGPSWNEANDFCTLDSWCPMGNECDESTGQKCWGGVANCNAFKLLEYETLPGVNNNGISAESHDNDNNQNIGDDNQNEGVNHNNYEGGDMGMGVQISNECSAEVYQCNSGQFVARAPELNCAFYPCPVITDDDETLSYSDAPTNAPVAVPVPTYSPTSWIVVPATVATTATIATASTTIATAVPPETTNLDDSNMPPPTLSPIDWVENDSSEYDTTINNNNESDSGSDLAAATTTTTNLWCGENRFDAIRNCGRKGYDCVDGYCLQDFKCYMISNQCDYGSAATTTTTTITGDASDTYFCGTSHTDAISSCHKRCRSGSPSECPAGESCFRNVYQCSAEIPRPDPTPPPTSLPTLSPMMMTTQIPSSHPTNDNLVVTASPTVSDDNEPVQPPNLPELYCARSMEELEASCATAQQCGGSEPCPFDHFCYPYECKGGNDSANVGIVAAKPTLPPATTAEDMPLPSESGGELGWFCGSSYEELETTCSTSSQRCVKERQDCPIGQWCYEYYCNTATLEDPVVEPNNPKVNDSVDQSFQNSGTSYCASSIAQLNERCGLATQCVSNNDCNVPGEVCVKYDCRQDLMLCPLNFVGWHSSKDCKQYYYCDQGVSSSSDSCGDGMKFDKSRDKCTTDYVDELCYGLASYEHDSGSITQPGIAKELCPRGFTGWHSNEGSCNEYQKCTAGNPGPTRVCGFGLKFDTARGQCIDEALVNIDLCEGPLPQGSLCPSWKFIGWGVMDDCAGYFYCKNGNTDFVDRCAGGLLFDAQEGICKPADAVNCGGLNLPNNSVDDIASSNNAPTPAPESSFEWSNTISPTVSQSDSKIPPWMLFKMDHNGAVRTTSLQVLFTFGSIISWMLL